MELNKAILNVITTMRKKDMLDGAFDTVKKAGYNVRYRGDGAFWEIENPETYKLVYFKHAKSYYSRDFIVLNGDNIIYNGAENCPIDFTNYLNKPINKEYYRVHKYQPTRDKYEILKNARYWTKYETEKTEKIKKEIASKQKELEQSIVSRCKEENRLKEIRKQYGLIK